MSPPVMRRHGNGSCMSHAYVVRFSSARSLGGHLKPWLASRVALLVLSSLYACVLFRYAGSPTSDRTVHILSTSEAKGNSSRPSSTPSIVKNRHLSGALCFCVSVVCVPPPPPSPHPPPHPLFL
eukprot:GDKI01041248.1.p2 GENE.GDKI01041248.1~~GDKI01041248.1.p2  ORF type:complete len:124 (+),score=21.67 GDKI01041248.1:15-386(+)